MKKIRIAISGIGNRAFPKNPSNSNWLGWVGQILKSGNFELAAAHDISRDSLDRVAKSGLIPGLNLFTDIDVMFKRTELEAILVCNPAAYHAETITKAADRRLHVLVEKPFVDDLGDGKKCLEIIKNRKIVVNVVQTWRAKSAGQVMFNSIRDGLLGRIGQVFFRYLRNRENPNLPGYIFKEKYPLLYAMGIHHFDLFRYILREDYASVSGSGFKPPWSLYESPTGVHLMLRTASGIPIIYTGTFSAPSGLGLQEHLLIDGEKGSLVNESDWLEPPLFFLPRGSQEKIDLTGSIREKSVREQYDLSDRSILDNFYDSIVDRAAPICSAEDGWKSVAAVEAARIACETQKAVYPEQIISGLA